MTHDAMVRAYAPAELGPVVDADAVADAAASSADLGVASADALLLLETIGPTAWHARWAQVLLRWLRILPRGRVGHVALSVEHSSPSATESLLEKLRAVGDGDA